MGHDRPMDYPGIAAGHASRNATLRVARRPASGRIGGRHRDGGTQMKHRRGIIVRNALVVMMSVFVPVVVARADLQFAEGARLVTVSVETRNGQLDDVIRRDVETALNNLHATDNADISVLVKDGIVWLSGSVPQWQGNSSRIHATRSVTGVRSIINRMSVVAR